MPQETYERMLPLLKELEKRRRKYFFQREKNSLILIAAGVALALIFFLMMSADYQSVPSVLWGAAAAVFLSLGTVSFVSCMKDSHFLRKYQEIYRTLLVPEMLKALELDARFNVSKGISGKAFKALSFFGSPHNKFQSSDKISGVADGVRFSISNVHSSIYIDSKGSTVTQFQGFLLLLEFNKKFKGRTYVLPDIAERLFGKSGRSLQKLFKRSRTSLIQLDDPEFEKAFITYSTDEVEARYLLSHSMMKRLLKLRERFGPQIRFSFRDDFVCLAIPTPRNYLVPKAILPATNEKQFHSVYRCLKMLLGVLYDLDLTTRIWSKP